MLGKYEYIGLMGEYRLPALIGDYSFVRAGFHSWKWETERGPRGDDYKADGLDPAIGFGVGIGMFRAGYEVSRLEVQDDDDNLTMHNFYVGVDFLQQQL